MPLVSLQSLLKKRNRHIANRHSVLAVHSLDGSLDMFVGEGKEVQSNVAGDDHGSLLRAKLMSAHCRYERGAGERTPLRLEGRSYVHISLHA